MSEERYEIDDLEALEMLIDELYDSDTITSDEEEILDKARRYIGVQILDLTVRNARGYLREDNK